MSRLRGFHAGLSQNRRLLLKDGRAINAWNLARAPRQVQSVGSAGPTDPEVGILAFDDERGDLMAVLFQFALHTNTNFGLRFSADYPGVVAGRIRERFGAGVSTLFVPGAFGDLNSPGLKHREVGNALADVIIRKLDERLPAEGVASLGSIKREVTVPYRDLTVDQEERIKASAWDIESQEVFRREIQIMRQEGKTEAKTLLQAWRVGEVGFACLPGEIFVEWGLKIKRESPFPWTYPVELGGDYLGYLVTRSAWEAGGYESLIARSARPSHEGVALMVGNALEMLNELYQEKTK
ncbi:MAG: hypothetical protein GWP05_07160 [Anaerolineaceae bacterium]|nr:hypothetical protein [Anaerolineaceae bacterium]